MSMIKVSGEQPGCVIYAEMPLFVNLEYRLALFPSPAATPSSAMVECPLLFHNKQERNGNVQSTKETNL